MKGHQPNMLLQPERNPITSQMVLDACLHEDIAVLKNYYNLGVDFDSIYDTKGNTLLHLSILKNKPSTFKTLLEFGVDIENPSLIDGSSPLNFAANLNKTYYMQQLINLGADVNSQDIQDYTPLGTALKNKSYDAVNVLLKTPGVDVNIPGDEGLYPPVVTASVNNRWDLVDEIIDHSSFDGTYNLILTNSSGVYNLNNYLLANAHYDGALLNAYKTAKLFGLRFDVDGCFNLNTLESHDFDCFNFGGYGNRIGIQNMENAYSSFYEKVISKCAIPDWADSVFTEVGKSLAFSATFFEPLAYYQKIQRGETVFIPSGWDGHSIVFVIYQDKLYRCNRGEFSDGVHGIEEFIMTKPHHLSVSLITSMLESAGDHNLLQYDIIKILGLKKISEIEMIPQYTNNCTWTSMEAGLEASLLINYSKQNVDNKTAHMLAKVSFNIWEQFDLSYSLKYILSQKEAFTQYGIYDDLLIKLLSNHHDPKNQFDVRNGAVVLNELSDSVVFKMFHDQIGQYVMRYDPLSYKNISYMTPYHPANNAWMDLNHGTLTQEGRLFASQYHQFLKACDDYQKKTDMSKIMLEDVLDLSFKNSLENLFDSKVSSMLSNNVASVRDAEFLLMPAIPLAEITAVQAEHLI